LVSKKQLAFWFSSIVCHNLGRTFDWNRRFFRIVDKLLWQFFVVEARMFVVVDCIVALFLGV
jgi:hypothetical protein